MTVRLGDIELTRLQVVEVDEARHLVEHRLPGGSGSVFQDLGRGAYSLVLAGILLGEQALRDIETLRAAHAESTPLRFSADIAVGSELTDVIIEELDIHQPPGHAFRFEFAMRLREWSEPPEPAGAAGAAISAVAAEVAADAAAWTSEALSIGGALDSPGALGDLLGANPDLLSRVDLDELSQAVTSVIGGLEPADFAHLLSTVGDIDPQVAIDLVEALGEADSLEDLFDVMVGSGIGLPQQLAGVDPSQVSALVKGFLGGPAFIDQLDQVCEAAQALLTDIQAFDPIGELAQLRAGTGS